MVIRKILQVALSNVIDLTTYYQFPGQDSCLKISYSQIKKVIRLEHASKHYFCALLLLFSMNLTFLYFLLTALMALIPKKDATLESITLFTPHRLNYLP